MALVNPIGIQVCKYDKNGEKVKQVVRINNIVIVLDYEAEKMQDNLIAYDASGNKVWCLTDIIGFPNSDFCTELSESRPGYIKVNTYYGLLYEIDIMGKKVVSREITK